MSGGAVYDNSLFMPVLLEVIVTNLAEALAAENGGADRLEIVRDLEQGGLTPSASIVADIRQSVSIPVRVMVRDNATMSVASAAEVKQLRSSAEQFVALGVDGLVAGFLDGGRIDFPAMTAVLPDSLATRVTFHRAFDEVGNQSRVLEQLIDMRQVDRVLTRGGERCWEERHDTVAKWQREAGSKLIVLFAVGLNSSRLSELAAGAEIREVHVGRAARLPHTPFGSVKRDQVATLKNLLQAAPRREPAGVEQTSEGKK